MNADSIEKISADVQMLKGSTISDLTNTAPNLSNLRLDQSDLSPDDKQVHRIVQEKIMINQHMQSSVQEEHQATSRTQSNFSEESLQVSRMRETHLLLSRRFAKAQDEVQRCHE